MRDNKQLSLLIKKANLKKANPKKANLKKENLKKASSKAAVITAIKKTSSKRANISKLCKDYICSPSSRTILPSSMGPQASLPSAAQPAVMDIRRLRRRSLALASDKVERGDARLR